MLVKVLIFVSFLFFSEDSISDNVPMIALCMSNYSVIR